jgi:outer membrane lipoprotein-sorting protein
MKFLRTASTRRLISVIAGVVIAIVAGSAIAIAASGSGPVPARKSLPKAIRGALAAPAPAGITARIKFTNNLIASSEVQNPGPLLGGGSGRLWLGGNHQLRLELQGNNGDAQVLVNQRSFWVYDPQSNTVYEGKLPAQSAQTGKSRAQEKLPTLAQIQSQLNQLASHVSLSGAIPSDVAGRPTYTLRVSPLHSGGLLGRMELAWDALRGVPLRFAVYSSNQSKPVLALQVTHISYKPVKAKVFQISPPAGAKVVKLSSPAGGSRTAEHGKGKEPPPVTGAANVAKHLSFPLSAPATLDGLPRQSVELLDWGGTPAALVSYGQNLGGIAVIEQKAEPGTAAAAKKKASSSPDQGGDRQSLTLPTVTINGATGQELDTAIGTVVRFTRAGVEYALITSLPPQAADAAARGL